MPSAVLSAWTALEVLSPQSFVRPEDLAGDPTVAGQAVARLDRGLPWEEGGERPRPKYRLYYQLVLGSVKLAPALEQLMKIYGDNRVERHAMRGEAALAVIMLDGAGRLVEGTPVSVSSFGCGLARALQNLLERLSNWQAVEQFLCNQIGARLSHTDADGNLLPLDAAHRRSIVASARAPRTPPNMRHLPARK